MVARGFGRGYRSQTKTQASPALSNLPSSTFSFSPTPASPSPPLSRPPSQSPGEVTVNQPSHPEPLKTRGRGRGRGRSGVVPNSNVIGSTNDEPTSNPLELDWSPNKPRSADYSPTKPSPTHPTLTYQSPNKPSHNPGQLPPDHPSPDHPSPHYELPDSHTSSRHFLREASGQNVSAQHNLSQQSNPKNRILARSKFALPAMRSLNRAMDDSMANRSVSDQQRLNHKANRPNGGQPCFNLSYKEPAEITKKPPPVVAKQSLSDGKHLLDPETDGVVHYTTNFYEKSKADKLFHILLGSLAFESPTWKKEGVVIKQPRLSLWFAPPGMPYKYSKVTLQPHDFSKNSVMSRIKSDIETHFGCTFNACLVNLYRDNKDGVGWHADNERSLGYKPTIGSVSLGETRRFQFCKIRDELKLPVYEFNLTHGSALLMKGDVQDKWLHSVPKEYHDRKPRINLTFRTIYGSAK